MERPTISIEPYIEGSGILGSKLEVNPKAADSVMKRTALNRNILVSRGFARDLRSAEGAHELALKKAEKKGNRTSTITANYSLEADETDWRVIIHDQHIADGIEEKIKPKDTSEFDKAYLAEFRNTLTSAIYRAHLGEFREYLYDAPDTISYAFFSTSQAVSFSFLVGLGVADSVNFAVGQGVDKTDISALVATGLTTMAMSFGVAYTEPRDLPPRTALVISALSGLVGIEFNRSRLIKLKDSKQK